MNWPDICQRLRRKLRDCSRESASGKGHSHRFGVAPAMSGLLLTVVQVFETRKEAETWVTAR